MYGEEGHLERVTDYDGAFVYRDGRMDYLLTEEGRLVYTEDQGWQYEYLLKDHLGNTRVTFRIDTAGRAMAIQENHYYPFGLSIATLDHSSLPEEDDQENKYLYNGKELQDENGLAWYDYGARYYDPQVGRWWSVDPMGENHFDFTLYNYVFNNPILLIDLFGMDFSYVIEPVVCYGNRKLPFSPDLRAKFYRLTNQYKKSNQNKGEDIMVKQPKIQTVADATFVVNTTIMLENEILKTGLKIGYLNTMRFGIYGENFYGNQYTKIIKLEKPIKVGGHLITAYMISKDLYQLSLVKKNGGNKNEAVRKLLSDVITSGVYYINAEVGLLIAVGQMVANSPEGKRMINESKREMERKKGLYHLPDGPLFFEPAKK